MTPTASTAATASSTLPGPTGIPAARKVRAKCIRLATSRPSGFSEAAACIGLLLLAGGGGDFGLDLFEQFRRLAALDARDVVLVFEEDAQRVVDRLRCQFERVQLHQRLGPVDRLGDAGE